MSNQLEMSVLIPGSYVVMDELRERGQREICVRDHLGIS